MFTRNNARQYFSILRNEFAAVTFQFSVFYFTLVARVSWALVYISFCFYSLFDKRRFCSINIMRDVFENEKQINAKKQRNTKL